jgi:hypothetical protein
MQSPRDSVGILQHEALRSPCRITDDLIIADIYETVVSIRVPDADNGDSVATGGIKEIIP